MEINEIDIDTFADSKRYEEPRLEPRGETLVVHGRNKTGKSLTFSAMGYGVIGEYWDKSVGSSAQVEVTFSDGTEYEASAGGHELTTPGGRSFTSQTARDERRERVTDRPFRDYFFFPSEIGQLSLVGKSEEEVLDHVREAVAPDRFERIDQLRGDKESELEKANRLREERSEIEGRLPKLSSGIESREERLQREERIVELHEDGQLEEIRETLAEHAELDEQLQIAYEEREELEEELREARRRRDRLQGGSTTEPSPEEFDLGCRVCGGTVSTETARERIDSGCCPLCDRGANFDTLLLEEERDEEPEELDERIAELEEELHEVEERIEQLQSEQPGLSELDDELLRRLNLRNRNVDRVVASARSEIEDIREKIERLERKREEDEERLEEIDGEIEEHEEEAEELEEEFQSIQQDVREDVVEFADRWTANFESMCSSLAEEIALDDNNGVTVAGDPDRSFHLEKNGLGEAEEQALCLSFAVTLHETLGDRLPLDTFVLDEPFDHLDDEATDELLSFVSEDEDRQYVFTTSDDTVVEAFSEEQRRELERDPKEVTLSDFEENDEQQPA